MSLNDLAGKHGPQVSPAQTVTAWRPGPMFSSHNYWLYETVAEVRACNAPNSNVVRVNGNGEWKWDGTSTATDDGTESTGAIAITGITTGRYLRNAGSTLSILTPAGTFAASGITRANKVASGSGVQSLVAGAITVPAAADVGAGAVSLLAHLAWGSSLRHTKTTVGPGHLTPTALKALSGTGACSECTIVDGTSIDRQSRGAVRVVPSVNAVAHTVTIAVAGTVGHRMKLSLKWRPSAVAGQAQQLQFLVYDEVGSLFARYNSIADGAMAAPGSASSPSANRHQFRNWKRADGCMQSELEWQIGATVTCTIYFISSAGANMAGDGTGIDIDDFDIAEVQPLAVENCAIGSASTITAVTASAPFVENAKLPEDGWSTDQSEAFRFDPVTDRFFSFQASCYEAITGSASLTWLWEPWETPTADGYIWNFAGATALLRVEHTTGDVVKVTRTNDAGVSVTGTFTSIIGANPAALSVVLDGTDAKLYRQGALVETIAFVTTGATSFTSGRFGGALKATVAEFAVTDSALSAEQARQTHVALAVRRHVRLDSMPVVLMLGQSNVLPNMPGRLLATFGSPAKNQARHCETTVVYDASQTYSGWGPTRTSHRKNRRGATNQFTISNPVTIGSQGMAGSEVGFHEAYGYCGTVRYGIGGNALYLYRDGQANRATMLAAFDAAIAAIGLPYYIAALYIEAGEDDALNATYAREYGNTLRVLATDFATRYNSGLTVPVVVNLLHAASVRDYLTNGELVRELTLDAANQSTTVGVAKIDHLPISQDMIHLGVTDLVDQAGDTQYEVGLLMAAAARAIGA